MHDQVDWAYLLCLSVRRQLEKQTCLRTDGRYVTWIIKQKGKKRLYQSTTHYYNELSGSEICSCFMCEATIHGAETFSVSLQDQD